MHALARGKDGFGRLLGAGKFAHDVRWRVQLFDFADAKIVGIVRHGVLLGCPARLTAQKSRQEAGGFFEGFRTDFRLSASLPPPAASENHKNKNKKRGTRISNRKSTR